MALNLSTLTGATSGEVLAEALTTADFLEPCPVLRNLSRGSNKGGDAKQTVGTQQPKALPLIDGDGYLYLPSVGGNNASIPDEAALDITGDITVECDFIVPSLPLSSERVLVAKYNTNTNNRSFQLTLNSASYIDFVISQDGTFNQAFSKSIDFSSVLSGRTRATVKATWRQSDGRLQFFIKESDGSFTQVGVDQTIAATSIYNSNQQVEIGSKNSGSSGVGDYLGVFGARIYASIDGTDKRLDVDFTATNVRHGDTKFKCATGQVITINQDSSSSNDVGTIIKKPVLRFDGVNSVLRGLLGHTHSEGYLFAAFTGLSTGGDRWGRVFTTNPEGLTDNAHGIQYIAHAANTSDIGVEQGSGTAYHLGLWDKEKNVLVDLKVTNGLARSRVNNADEQAATNSFNVSTDQFNIGANEGTETRNNGENAPLDLEYLALFPSSITDAQASKIRDYINKRNQIYLRHQTDGFYFFNPQKATFTGNFTGANTLDGYITGSDLGDTDVRTNLTLEQSTLNDQPSTDGYTITFNDAAEHLEFENAASQNLSGWQVCGTSLGTFVYRVQGAVTELNLLGNAGSVRTSGELYGIILLPESATGKDIEEARKLLIDRGAADGAATSSFLTAWSQRSDIVEFKPIDFSSVTDVASAWRDTSLVSFDLQLPDVESALRSWQDCSSLESFSAELPSATTVHKAFIGCSSLSDFKTTEIPNCTNFSSTWKSTTALTSFPADAKLGTAANNVNFSSAWQQSGLTSFSTPLPTATNASLAWLDCTSLISFNVPLPLATNVNGTWYNCSSLTNFSSDLSSATNPSFAWYNCTSLASFNTPLPLAVNMNGTWLNCTSLTDFSADVFANWNPSSLASGIFNDTWDNCPLTAQSVENILTSIDASGKYATSDGDAYVNGVNTQLADAGIDIDYNGDPLSAATNTAIDSLSGKGWEVFINGVLVIPNILDLQPAAAYSLRSFDADADPNVVNVRRSSDNATSDFKASEVSDGTLTDWVNTDVVLASSDFASTLSPFSLYGATLTTTELNQSIAGVGGALKITFGGDGAFLRRLGSQTLGIGNQFKVSVKVYLPSSNDYVDGISIGITGLDTTYPSTVLSRDTWHTIEFTGIAAKDSQTNGFRVFGNNSNSSVDDVIYIKDYDITQLTADGHVTTWYDQGGTNHATQTLVSNMPLLVDGGTLVTEGGLAALDFDGVNSFVNLQHSDLYGQSVLDSYYVTSTTDDSYIYPASGGSSPYGMVAQVGSGATSTSSNYGSPSYYANGTAITPVNRGTIHTATSGGQKLVAHLGANTSYSGWSSMIFGRYTSTNGFAYDGKLQEMIFFNTDQSANRTGIENNINDTYTIY